MKIGVVKTSFLLLGLWIMAMSTCKEYGREVSTLAKTCPGCGESNPGKAVKQKLEIKGNTHN